MAKIALGLNKDAIASITHRILIAIWHVFTKKADSLYAKQITPYDNPVHDDIE